MTKFKVDDRIKLTYTDSWDNSIITKVVEGSEFQYTFTKPNGISGAEREEYLELAEPAKETYEVNKWLKPLMWVDGDFYCEARVLGLVFSISLIQGKWFYGGAAHSNPDQAKAAAQADYEARVLACLE